MDWSETLIGAILSYFFLLLATLMVPLAAAGSESTPTRRVHARTHALHFRYFPQRAAEIIEPTSSHKLSRVRLGSRISPVEDENDRSIAVSLNGRFVYSVQDSYYARQYRIGRRSKIAGKERRLRPLEPFKTPAHSHPMSVSLHPNGRFAYVSCSHGTICQYRISRSGRLVPLSSREVYGRNDPSPLRFDPSGRFACVATYAGEISGSAVDVYRVSGSGALKLIRTITTGSPHLSGGLVVRGNKVSDEK